jgi:hypothetical protein
MVQSVVTLDNGTKITVEHGENATDAEISQAAIEAYNTEAGVMYNKDGTVVREDDGVMSLSSPAYSTNNQEAIQRFLDDEDVTAADLSKSSMYQSVLDQRPYSSRAAQVLNIPYAGEYLDEAVGNIYGEQGTNDLRLMRDAMASEKPVETFGLNVAGSAAATAPIMAALPEGAAAGLLGAGEKVLPKILKGSVYGSALGGLEGLVSGYGRGKDDEDRKNQAVTGAAFGTGFGTLAGPFAGLIHGGKKLWENFVGTTSSKIAKELGISEPAARVIKETFDSGGDINVAVANIERAGSEGMVVDSGKAAEALLDAASSLSPEGASTATKNLGGRMSRSRENVSDTLDETLGTPPLGPKQAVGDIANRTKDARNKAYEEAYNSPIPYANKKGDVIVSVLDRIPNRIKKEAIEKANELMQISGITRDKHIKAEILDNGDIIFSSDPNKMPNIMQLDYMKRALGNLAYKSSNLDNFGRLTADGQVYQGLSRDLKNAVSDAVPLYGKAVKLGGDKISEEAAFGIGSKLLNTKTSVEDVVLAMRNGSDAEKAAAKQGLRFQIETILNNVKNIASNQFDDLSAREVSQAVKDLSSDNARTKIRAVLGQEADAFLSQIDEVAQSSRILASQALNSKTAPRQVINEFNKAIVDEGNFFRGASLGDAVKSLISSPVNEPKLFREMYADVAKALTESRGPDAIKALRFINKAIKDGNISDDNLNFVTQQLTLTGYASLPTASKLTNDAVIKE